MNKLLAIIIVFASLALTTTHTCAATAIEHYTFHYENGDTYDVKLNDNTVTWKGLEGGDKGQSEMDYIKRKMLAKNIEVIQWNEMDGTFVTLVFDRANLIIISSGKTSEGDWFMQGNATQLDITHV